MTTTILPLFNGSVCMGAVFLYCVFVTLCTSGLRHLFVLDVGRYCRGTWFDCRCGGRKLRFHRTTLNIRITLLVECCDDQLEEAKSEQSDQLIACLLLASRVSPDLYFCMQCVHRTSDHPACHRPFTSRQVCFFRLIFFSFL